MMSLSIWFYRHGLCLLESFLQRSFLCLFGICDFGVKTVWSAGHFFKILEVVIVCPACIVSNLIHPVVPLISGLCKFRRLYPTCNGLCCMFWEHYGSYRMRLGLMSGYPLLYLAGCPFCLPTRNPFLLDDWSQYLPNSVRRFWNFQALFLQGNSQCLLIRD